MKLDPDCVRSVLLCVESSTDPEGSFCFRFSDPTGFMDGLSVNDPVISINSRPELSDFTEDQVRYHLKQCGDAGLLNLNDSICSDTVWVNDLTPAGHKFLADTREDTIWKTTKAVMKKTGASSLTAITQIASGVLTAIIQNELSLIRSNL